MPHRCTRFRYAVSVACVVLGLLIGPGVRAQSIDDYVRLVETANAAFDEADANQAPTSRAVAVAAGDAVIAWLRAYEASDAFSELPDEQQVAVVTDRHRWSYNVARQLVALGDCDDAEARMQALLDEGIRDAELLPRASATFREAADCAAPPPTAWVIVRADPPDAIVYASGELLGPVMEPYALPLGEHELEVRAPGHQPFQARVDLVTADATTRVGPLTLVATEVFEPPPRRTAAPAALWATALVGVTSGIGLVAAGEIRADRADAPPAGQELADPRGERRAQRILRGTGIGLISAGVAAGVSAPLVRRAQERRLAVDVVWLGPGAGIRLQAR